MNNMMEENRTLAVILDGIVIEVVRFNERFAALLMSNPTFVDITENNIEQGWNYEDGKFIKMTPDGPITIDME